MPKVSGTITLYFENVEFEDDGQMTLRDQAIDALKMESFSDGDLVDVQIDTLEVTKARGDA